MLEEDEFVALFDYRAMCGVIGIIALAREINRTSNSISKKPTNNESKGIDSKCTLIDTFIHKAIIEVILVYASHRSPLGPTLTATLKRPSSFFGKYQPSAA